jgi:hypothetical protein
MIAHQYKYETPMTDYVDLTIYEKNRMPRCRCQIWDADIY